MKAPLSYRNKILQLPELLRRAQQWRLPGKTIAFTNGCFDLLHAGHIDSLSAAAAEADYLVVGLNSDASVKRLKGESRPLNDEQSRAMVLASLLMVDAVVLFGEDTPRELIAALLPDVLVKGGDYKVEDIAGAAEVQAAGGRVVINPIREGFSTTGIIEKMKQ
ncbi:D-glycero-beta-D-manno-heptose 1-phosphate adenylyltransferase [Flaviaesturariibacter amylovorans]|uniref:D-glycero-beta-D-manno-heptose 1-phosphate adenylyltransferase n=1 Tax=Flaviaesturariibacter amylovorans TaxID=1084520 RepID=A0ABP8GT76_9BACT